MMLVLKHICQSVLRVHVMKAFPQPIGMNTGKHVLQLLSHYFTFLFPSLLSMLFFLVKCPLKNIMNLNNSGQDKSRLTVVHMEKEVHMKSVGCYYNSFINSVICALTTINLSFKKILRRCFY